MLESLGLELKEIIFVMVNFLILVGVLGKFIYKPFLGALENRKRTIQESFDQADTVNRRAEAKMASYKRRIANAEDESREIIKEAKKQAEAYTQQMIKEAEEKSAEIIKRAQRTIEEERAKATEDMRKEIADLALLAAEQIIGREIDVTGQEAIVDDVIRNVGSGQWQN